MSQEPKTHPVTFYPDRPKIQTDDHYPLSKAVSENVRPTGQLRWSELGVLQQEYQSSLKGLYWQDVPSEKPK